jgi:O-antigen/teichoic acid export membrane protein
MTETTGQVFARNSVRQRVLRGLGATALGPVVTTFVQVVSVPVFLHFWGTRLYGEWLILSALPAYLALSDLGFGNVAANDMTMRVAAGDRKGALAVFQSTWILVTSLSALLGIFAVATALLLPLHRWLSISSMSSHDVRMTVVLLSMYALMSLQGPIILAGFRCDGHFPAGALLTNIIRIIEALVATAAVFLHARPVHVAALYLGMRTLSLLVFAAVMLSMTPWIRYGVRQATSSCIRALMRPAFAFMAFPAGNALSIQGIVLAVGIVLGPIAVATFSTMRTLTRFVIQVMDSIKNSVWPELSAAYGAQDWRLARKLHRHACQASLWLAALSVAGLFVFGPRIYAIWTHGRVTMDPTTFHLLLLVMLANSFWSTSSVVALATNRHQRLAAVYICATAASVALAFVLTRSFQLPGAAVSLLVVDFATGWFVIRESLGLLQDSFGGFARSLVNLPSFAAIRY